MARSKQLECAIFIVTSMVVGALLWESPFSGQVAHGEALGQSPMPPKADPKVNSLFTDLSEDEIRAGGFTRFSSDARPGERPRIARLDWNLVSNALRDTARVCLRISSSADCREFFPRKPATTVPPFNGPGGTITRLSWVGRVSGDPSSEAVFIIRDHDQAMSGTIRYQRRIYDINPVGRATISIVEVNPNLYVPDKSPGERRSSPPATVIPQADRLTLPLPSPIQVQTGGKTKIDVMVVYTQQARAAVEASCSLCLITDKIVVAVAQANSSLGMNSRQEFSLVYVNEVNDSQSSVNTALSFLQGIGDGVFDQVDQWRCTFRPDVVILWLESAPPEPCGEAYGPMKWLGSGTWGYYYPDPQNYAFSVVRRNCAINFLTFHHELGHVMGADHDRANVIARGGIPDGYGYGYINGGKATIMAAPPSSSSWFENVWSSDFLTFSDGSQAGTSTDNNRRVLNETSEQVSSFSARPCPNATPSSDTSVPTAPRNITIQ